MTEEWRKIPGWPEYEASNHGRVRSNGRHIRSVSKTGKESKRWIEGVIRRQSDVGGYKSITLARKGRKFTTYVHRLVLLAFIPPTRDGLDVNHIDGNKANNFLNNLEWVTRSENVRHAIDVLGRGRALLDNERARQIVKRLAAGDRPVAIAQEHGVSAKVVGQIAAGACWTHISGGRVKRPPVIRPRNERGRYV